METLGRRSRGSLWSPGGCCCVWWHAPGLFPSAGSSQSSSGQAAQPQTDPSMLPQTAAPELMSRPCHSRQGVPHVTKRWGRPWCGMLSPAAVGRLGRPVMAARADGEAARLPAPPAAASAPGTNSTRGIQLLFPLSSGPHLKWLSAPCRTLSEAIECTLLVNPFQHCAGQWSTHYERGKIAPNHTCHGPQQAGR